MLATPGNATEFNAQYYSEWKPQIVNGKLIHFNDNDNTYMEKLVHAPEWRIPHLMQDPFARARLKEDGGTLMPYCCECWKWMEDGHQTGRQHKNKLLWWKQEEQRKRTQRAVAMVPAEPNSEYDLSGFVPNGSRSAGEVPPQHIRGQEQARPLRDVAAAAGSTRPAAVDLPANGFSGTDGVRYQQPCLQDNGAAEGVPPMELMSPQADQPFPPRPPAREPMEGASGASGSAAASHVVTQVEVQHRGVLEGAHKTCAEPTQWDSIFEAKVVDANPLSVAPGQHMNDLKVEITVWDVKSREDVQPHVRKEVHSSRASRTLSFFNKVMGWTGDPEKELEIAKAVMLVGARQTSPRKGQQDRNEDQNHNAQTWEKKAVRDLISSGRPLFSRDGRNFFPCAPNPEQTAAQKLWLLSVPCAHEAPEALVKAFQIAQGNFTEVENVYKRAVRLKLLFSFTVPTAEGFDLTRIDDIQNGKYKFTDGCGKISQDLLQAVKDRYREIMGMESEEGEQHDRDATAVQIRVLGNKGLVVLDLKLEGRCLELPESMRKFSVPGKDTSLGKGQKLWVEGVPIEVVEFPHIKNGALPRQVLQVIWGNSVAAADKAVLQSQEQKLDEAFTLANDPSTERAIDSCKGWPWSRSFMQNASRGEHDNHHNCMRKVLAGFDPKFDTHIRKQLIDNADSETKSLAKRVPMDGIRNAMIVPDWSGALPEGTLLDNSLADELNASAEDKYCAIAKCPLYELGNLRRLRMVRPSEYPDLQYHKGYIVLSTRGERPEADKAFGSDFDGDEIFLITHPALVPEASTPEPQDYATGPVPESAKRHNVSLAECIGLFMATKWESSCGLLDTHLMNIAARGKDNMSGEEYKKLALMFCQEVDSEKTGLHIDPKEMESLQLKALGRNNKHRFHECIVDFLAHDDDFEVKPAHHGKRIMQTPSLLSSVFKAARDKFQEQGFVRDRELKVKQLDPDLEKAWESIGGDQRNELLHKAKTIWGSLKKKLQQVMESLKKEKEDHERLSWVRKAALQKRRSSAIDEMLEEQRRDAKELAKQHEVPFEHLALAMYILKYDDHRKNGIQDGCQFPWNIVTPELIAVKSEKRKTSIVATVDLAVLDKLQRQRK